LNCIDEGATSIEKIEKYAKDSEDFFFRQERKFSGEYREVTPIEDTIEISNLSTSSTNNDTAEKK
jgi:hypothetical protein